MIRIVIVARDITGQRTTEESLVQSEERYRQLVDSLPDAGISYHEGKIIFTNPAAISLIGVSHADDIPGKNVFDFMQRKKPLLKKGDWFRADIVKAKRYP